jgi:hypothetical protein
MSPKQERKERGRSCHLQDCQNHVKRRGNKDINSFSVISVLAVKLTLTFIFQRESQVLQGE